jgi:hypothetical protein
VAGKKYQQVSEAYYRTVHHILSGDVSAEAGLRDLEERLVVLTGMPAREPERGKATRAD